MDTAYRPDWDEFWFVLALFYSTRGTCNRLRTACVIVDENNHLISAGYNGSPPGTEHCDDAGHLIIDGHCLRTLHAEENAVIHKSRSLKGATAYLLDSPCLKCAKMLISSGVKRIVYAREFTNMQGGESGWQHLYNLASASEVSVEHYPIDFNQVVDSMFDILQSRGGALKR